MHFHLSHTADDNYRQLTTAPVPGLIMKLAVPTIISMLVTSFYNMADTYFVGKIDTQSTAAVGIVFSLMSVIQAIGFFFGHGSGNYMSRSLVLNNQMRFQGNALYAMVGIVSGAFINVALDPLFIFVFDMGVAGAAVATVISQVCSFTLLLFMSRRGGNIRIRYRNFTPTLAFLKEIVSGGTPSLARQGLASLSTILLNLAAGQYGDAAIAGMSIVSRIGMFINAFFIGFGQGFQPVCGFSYGAQLYARVRQTQARAGHALVVGASGTFLHSAHLYLAACLGIAGSGDVPGRVRYADFPVGHSHHVQRAC